MVQLYISSSLETWDASLCCWASLSLLLLFLPLPTYHMPGPRRASSPLPWIPVLANASARPPTHTHTYTHTHIQSTNHTHAHASSFDGPQLTDKCGHTRRLVRALYWMQPLVPPTPLFFYFFLFFPPFCLLSACPAWVKVTLPSQSSAEAPPAMACSVAQKTAQAKEKKGFERASVALLFAFGSWLGRFILSLHATIPTSCCCCCFSSTCPDIRSLLIGFNPIIT